MIVLSVIIGFCTDKITFSKNNPPCESLWAELVHGVIERSEVVFADRGAL